MKPHDAPASLREQAMDRVLSPARVRAEERLESFLDAARDLMGGSSGTEFTVQELVERSGQSLRSFYQYFEGKDALLLALFEDAVRSTATELSDIVSAEETPLAKLHRFAVEYYRLCCPSPKGRRSAPRALANFSQQLLTEHPSEASRAFRPLNDLLEGLFDEAAAAGMIRAGLPHSRAAGVVLQSLMFNAYATTIGGSSARSTKGDPAEELWDLLLHGMAMR